MRSDLLAIVHAAIDGASAAHAVSRAIVAPEYRDVLARPVHVIAVGKAAAAMSTAIVSCADLHITRIVAIGTHRGSGPAPQVEWHDAAHPVPDHRSVAAADRALVVASEVAADEGLILLLSGGASALMARPATGITLEDKQHTVRTMLLAGADIHALNTVRKHLSAVKGGRLAAACRGATLTLAVSDVLDDDLSVIGSGPGVADATTWADAAAALQRFGGPAHRPSVRALIERGLRGDVDETPKPGDGALARATAAVIASRRDAVDRARQAAIGRGYHVVILDEPVRGEARDAAVGWFASAGVIARAAGIPTCVLSAGETTVHVTGDGRGGRNQEFVLSLVGSLAADAADVVAASVGTDGIDGPTDAAGALVDRTTRDRAAALGLHPATFLRDNNSYDFFALLGDLIHLGPTDTNVGDVQVLLSVTLP